MKVLPFFFLLPLPIISLLLSSLSHCISLITNLQHKKWLFTLSLCSLLSPVCQYMTFDEETWQSSLSISHCSSRPVRCSFKSQADTSLLYQIFVCAFSSLLWFLIHSALLSPETLLKTDAVFPHFPFLRHRVSLSLHHSHVTVNSSAVSFHSLFRLVERLLSSLQGMLHFTALTWRAEIWCLDYAQEMGDWR